MKNLSDKAKALLDSMDSLDEFGFQIRPYFYWLPEPTEDEIKRLEMNLAIYKGCINYRSRFPDEINAQRIVEFRRIRELRSILYEVV